MKPNPSQIAVLVTAALLSCFVIAESAQATSGDLDPTFGNGGMASSLGFFGHAVAIQPDGKVVAAGNGVERYNPNGSPDASFRIAGRAELTTGGLVPCYGKVCFFEAAGALAVAIQADGKIIAVWNGAI